MVCIHCSGETRIINSRPQKRTNTVWRRHKCTLCDAVFSTTEAPDYSNSLLVAPKPGGQLAPFARDRLLLSLYKSLGHRGTALADAGALTATIIAKLTPQAQHGVLQREHIIQTTLVALNRFDTLAAQHYAAFHTL